MSKTIKVTNRDLPDHVELFDLCGKVMRGEREANEPYMKFKYACGRNWDKVNAMTKAASAKYHALTKSAPEYRTILLACEDSRKIHCTKDAQGAPVMEKDERGVELYTFTSESLATCDAEIKAIVAKSQAVYDAHQAKLKAGEEFLNEEVSIDLFTVPFSMVPERISAAFIPAISIMLTDIPEDVEADPMRMVE